MRSTPRSSELGAERPHGLLEGRLQAPSERHLLPQNSVMRAARLDARHVAAHRCGHAPLRHRVDERGNGLHARRHRRHALLAAPGAVDRGARAHSWGDTDLSASGGAAGRGLCPAPPQRACRLMRPRDRAGSGGRCALPLAGGDRAPRGVRRTAQLRPRTLRRRRSRTLVSNTKQTHDASVAHVVGAVGCSQFSQAQRLITSDNKGGDTSFSVQVHIKEYAGIDEVNVRICSADASDKLRSSFYALTNPCLGMGGSFNTSSAWSNATLEKVEQYFVVVKTTSRSLQIGLRVNDKPPSQV